MKGNACASHHPPPRQIRSAGGSGTGVPALPARLGQARSRPERRQHDAESNPFRSCSRQVCVRRRRGRCHAWWQPHARALSLRLGGEERIEHPLQYGRRYAVPGVGTASSTKSPATAAWHDAQMPSRHWRRRTLRASRPVLPSHRARLCRDSSGPGQLRRIYHHRRHIRLEMSGNRGSRATSTQQVDKLREVTVNCTATGSRAGRD